MLQKKGTYLLIFSYVFDHSFIVIKLFFPVHFVAAILRRVLSIYILITPQIDPGPGATIGGMLSMGCSGSLYSTVPTYYSRCSLLTV